MHEASTHPHAHTVLVAVHQGCAAQDVCWCKGPGCLVLTRCGLATPFVCSFGVLLWVMLRCLPPWVKKDNGFARNKLLGKYPPGTPEPYVALTARYVGTGGCVGGGRPWNT
jgi:hypothetical protein